MQRITSSNVTDVSPMSTSCAGHVDATRCTGGANHAGCFSSPRSRLLTSQAMAALATHRTTTVRAVLRVTQELESAARRRTRCTRFKHRYIRCYHNVVLVCVKPVMIKYSSTKQSGHQQHASPVCGVAAKGTTGSAAAPMNCHSPPGTPALAAASSSGSGPRSMQNASTCVFTNQTAQGTAVQS